LAFVEFGIAILTNGSKMVEVVYTKIIVKVRFRVTIEIEVFIVKADRNVLIAVIALVCILLYSNCFLCKCLKLLLTSLVRLQKNWKLFITMYLATIKV